MNVTDIAALSKNWWKKPILIVDLPARCQFSVDIVCHRSFLWFLIIIWTFLLSNWVLNGAYVYWWKWVHTFDTDRMSIPSILVFVDRRFLIIVWNYCQIILCWIWRLFVCLIMMILVFLKTQEELVGRVHPDSGFYVLLPAGCCPFQEPVGRCQYLLSIYRPDVSSPCMLFAVGYPYDS